VLADVGRNGISVLWVGVGQDVLDQVVAILVAGDVDERNPGAVNSTLADAVQVTAQELGSANLQTLLYHLGRELVHAVLGCVADDMIDGSAAIGGGAVLADVLDAPVAELAMSNDVDVLQDFFDAGALNTCQSRFKASSMIG